MPQSRTPPQVRPKRESGGITVGPERPAGLPSLELESVQRSELTREANRVEGSPGLWVLHELGPDQTGAMILNHDDDWSLVEAHEYW